MKTEINSAPHVGGSNGLGVSFTKLPIIQFFSDSYSTSFFPFSPHPSIEEGEGGEEPWEGGVEVGCTR